MDLLGSGSIPIFCSGIYVQHAPRPFWANRTNLPTPTPDLASAMSQKRARLSGTWHLKSIAELTLSANQLTKANS